MKTSEVAGRQSGREAGVQVELGLEEAVDGWLQELDEAAVVCTVAESRPSSDVHVHRAGGMT